MSRLLTRRALLTSSLAAPVLLGGCDRLSKAPSFRELVLNRGEQVTQRVQRWLVGDALAREYAPEDMSPNFRTNGSTDVRDATYRAHRDEGFANWQLQVDGLVHRPRGFTMAQLRALPQRAQITRHDCVEGWSAIGKWEGPRLSAVLNTVGLREDARFIVFHCADMVGGLSPVPYYESIDLRAALHEQTILAHRMNDEVLSVGHGAPLRLRVERQLGYKQAKFIMRIEVTSSLEGIGQGKGGYWEDVGYYEWYAGV